MHKVAVRYGAASKPGVDIGTGNSLSPPSGWRSASPLITTSWQAAVVTRVGAIGLAMARSQASPISSTGRPMPSA